MVSSGTADNVAKLPPQKQATVYYKCCSPPATRKKPFCGPNEAHQDQTADSCCVVLAGHTSLREQLPRLHLKRAVSAWRSDQRNPRLCAEPP